MLRQLAIVILLLSSPVPAGGSDSNFKPVKGYLGINVHRVAWPSPESLVNQLQSKKQEVRLKALKLLGAHRPWIKVWSQTSPSRVIGKRVVAPDQVRLTYASLGAGPTQDAVIAVDLEQTQTVLAAVAIPKKSGWERIGVSSCWCKYEMYLDRDVLATTVQMRPAPDNPAAGRRFELVLRASTGGTGTYTQHEDHFRIWHGDLQAVISFESRHLSCDPTASGEPCSLHKRWFYATSFGKVLGGVLISAQGSFRRRRQPPYEWILRQLQYGHLKTFSCSTYQWDAETFQYVSLPVAVASRLAGPYGNPCVSREK